MDEKLIHTYQGWMFQVLTALITEFTTEIAKIPLVASNGILLRSLSVKEPFNNGKFFLPFFIPLRYLPFFLFHLFFKVLLLLSFWSEFSCLYVGITPYSDTRSRLQFRHTNRLHRKVSSLSTRLACSPFHHVVTCDRLCNFVVTLSAKNVCAGNKCC